MNSFAVRIKWICIPLKANLKKNLPLTLALLSIWNSIALNAGTLCFLPYEHRLRHMIQWLQQLQMESLGKSRLTNGELTFFPTGRIVWGGLGNDAQHTFFQCLRQGVARTAIDILLGGQTCSQPYRSS